MRVSLKFEPRDLWVGAYITKYEDRAPRADSGWKAYVCLVPCFPLEFKFSRVEKRVSESSLSERVKGKFK